MDAVEYLKTMKRICYQYTNGCNTCPLSGNNSCVYGGAPEDPEEAVDIVEQWSKEHPVVTNADKLLEVFGKFRLSNITPEWLRQEYRESKGKE